MKNNFFLTGVFLFFILASGVSEAFVPQTPYLLHLVMEKIKKPVGMEVFQTKKIVNKQDMETGFIDIEEKLIYLYPDRFRSDVISEAMTSFCVESDFRFIKVMDGVTISHEKSLTDQYSDILLYRDPESLLNQLALAGVDTQKVSFQRYDKTICYVIGRPLEKGKPFAGLWIEKETLFPIRYLVEKNGRPVEFLYKNWKKVSKSWYPGQVYIFLDNQLFCVIDVKRIELKSDFLQSLFDIEHIEQLYPKKIGNSFNENSKQVEELDKRMEEFKKLYE